MSSEVVERSLGLYMRREKLFAFACQSFSSHFLNPLNSAILLTNGNVNHLIHVNHFENHFRFL